MKDIASFISELWSKTNDLAGHFWPIYLKHIYIQAWWDVAIFLIFISLSIGAISWLNKEKRVDIHKYGALCEIVWVFSICVALLSLGFLYEATQYFLNPDYAALQLLLKAGK